MTTDTLTPPPRSTANPAPVRALASLRRTTSIDVSWPDGADQPRRFEGRARDLMTGASGDSEMAGKALLEARLDDEKNILSISADPEPDELQTLVGQRAGGHLRMFIRENMPGLVERAEPLYLLLDDLSGSALVSNISWSLWDETLMVDKRAELSDEDFVKMMAGRANVCWGLKEGNSGLQARRSMDEVADADAGELRNPADPEGWHEFPAINGPAFRRARRIDVTDDAKAGVLRIDSMFQDSAKTKDGGRTAIHEYLLRATVERNTMKLLTLEPEARILPFPECPGAIANTQRLIGTPLGDIRDEVLAQLRGPEGCTHLNDAMRALADVPVLAEAL